jgi:hypothetical protein
MMGSISGIDGGLPFPHSQDVQTTPRPLDAQGCAMNTIEAPQPVASVEQFAFDKLYLGIAQHTFGGSPPELYVAETQDAPELLFDPKEIAHRILEYIAGFIETAREQGDDDTLIESLMAQARAGVDLGFEQARDELDEAGVLDDELVGRLDESYELIQQGLDELEAGRYVPRARENVGVHRQEMSRMDLTTADGDKVSLAFGYHLAGDITYADDTQAIAMQLSERSELMVSVEGDLSREELKRIADLVVDLDSLGSLFFSQDLDHAFEHASLLGFDDSLLASIANNYQQTPKFKGYGQPGPLAQLVPNLHQFMVDWQEIRERSTTLFKSPETIDALIDQVFSQSVSLEHSDAAPLTDRFYQFSERMFTSLQTMPGR